MRLELGGRLDPIGDEVVKLRGEQDALTAEVQILGRVTRKQFADLDGLPEKVAAAVTETTVRDPYQLQADVAEVTRAAGL